MSTPQPTPATTTGPLAPLLEPTGCEDCGLAPGSLQRVRLPTVLNRMGGWTNALRATGMDPGTTPARARKRRWTDEACWTALRQVVRELGHTPTVLAYERHAAGRAELPSSATLRNRLGRWSSITTQLAAQSQAAREARERERSDALAARSA